MGLVVNFSDFENKTGTSLSASDYLVGYTTDFDGNRQELKITVADLITFLESNSGNDLYTILYSNSASWNSVYNSVNSNSGSWDSVYSTTNVNSATWKSNYTTTSNNSAFWSEAYTNLVNNSAAYLSGFDLSSLASASGSWDSNYSTTRTNSAYWSQAYTNLVNNSASWDSVYSSFNSNSSQYTTLDYLSTNNVLLSALTVNGSISATSLNVFSLSSRSIDLIHTPANDGTNPVFRIGELTSGSTTLSGFSGMFMSYNESSNVFGISAQFAPRAGLPAISIHRNANVGIGTDDNSNALTVNGAISSNGVITVLRGNSNQWNSTYTTLNTNSGKYESTYTTLNYISSVIPDPATIISSQIAVGTIALSSINFLNTLSGQLLYTVPAGKVFLVTDYSIIIDGVVGGNSVLDTSLPTFRLYRHDTLTSSTYQVTNTLTPTTAVGTTITTNRYYRMGGSVAGVNGKALVSGNDASPQNKVWFRVDSTGTNTYTGLSGRVLVTGNLL